MPSIWGAMPNWLPSNEVMHSAPLRLPCLPRPLSSVPQMFLRPSAERSSAFWPASVDLAPRGDGGDQRVVDDHGGAAELGQVGQGLDAGKAGHAFGLERDAELVAAERGGDALEAALGLFSIAVEAWCSETSAPTVSREVMCTVTSACASVPTRWLAGGRRIDVRPGPPPWLAIFEFGAHQRGRRRFCRSIYL